MAKEKEYEYHKQNDYPGERVAERKRVAEREEDADKRANARVAAKGRREQASITSERQTRDTADTMGRVIITGLIIILVGGLIWSLYTISYLTAEIEDLNAQIYTSSNSDLGKTQINLDANQPTVLGVSALTSEYPSNNNGNLPVNVQIDIMFSEDMNPSTINRNTIMVERKSISDQQYTTNYYNTEPIQGEVMYSNQKATFTSTEMFGPNEIYDNVFIVTIGTEVEDMQGNSLEDTYMWNVTANNEALYNE